MNEQVHSNGAPPFDVRQQPLFDAGPIVERAQGDKAKADAEVAEKEAEAQRKAAEALLRDSWGTPQKLFDQLHAEFQFSVDASAELWNRKLDRYIGPGSAAPDVFQTSLAGERWWWNPPFSRLNDALAYAWKWFSLEARQYGMLSQLGVMLLPSTRTEQKPWQELVEPFRDKPAVWQQIGASLETRFITVPTTKSKYGRVQFDVPPGLKKSSNTVGSVLLIWRAL